jgi:hypothetical protein
MTLNAEVLRLKQRWMQVKPEQTFVNYLNIFSRPVRILQDRVTMCSAIILVPVCKSNIVRFILSSLRRNYKITIRGIKLIEFNYFF